MTIYTQKIEKHISGNIHLTFDGIDGVIVVNNKKQILMLNPAAEKIFQCSSVHAFGLPLFHLWPFQKKENFLQLPINALEKSYASTLTTILNAPQILLRSQNKTLAFETSHFKILSHNEWLYALVFRPARQNYQDISALDNNSTYHYYPKQNSLPFPTEILASQQAKYTPRDVYMDIASLDKVRAEQKKKLAQEMHDDFGQLLAAMKMDLDQIKNELPLDNHKLSIQFENLNKLVDTMMVSVRRIIADLPPKNLEDYGLFKSIEILVQDFKKRFHLHCKLSLPKVPLSIDCKIESLIYRILQESLNNISKHAQASHVDIEIKEWKNCLLISITDNGKGMTKECVEKIGSFGLRSLRERITALKGEMRLESIPEAGTSIEVTIPLYEKSAVLSH